MEDEMKEDTHTGPSEAGRHEWSTLVGLVKKV